ncbi:peroxiredoxin [Patescibacteria group bacterium]|nr:peroxiredoxin [Patescibacteria group bacterium]
MTNEPVIKVGDKAPQFTLEDQKGNTVKLKDFLDKKSVVLIFYPGDMTPGCTIQLCGIRDQWPKFDKNKTVVFGVNHADAKSHDQFIKKYSFPFPLLVDVDKKVSKKYGAIKKLFSAMVIKRTVVIIDQKGIITFYKHGMPKEADILKSIK